MNVPNHSPVFSGGDSSCRSVSIGPIEGGGEEFQVESEPIQLEASQLANANSSGEFNGLELPLIHRPRQILNRLSKTMHSAASLRKKGKTLSLPLHAHSKHMGKRKVLLGQGGNILKMPHKKSYSFSKYSRRPH